MILTEVILYTRAGCQLCEETRRDLETLREQYPHHLRVIDIDQNPDLQSRFFDRIPVVQVGSQTLDAPIEQQALGTFLAKSIPHSTSPDTHLQPGMRSTTSQPVSWNRADDFGYWLTRHYLAIFNLFILFYVGLPVLAPVFMKVGAELPAQLIYRGYGMLCHQLAYRSVFLFGEQPIYPRASANPGELLTYEQATGLSGGDQAVDRFEARGYIGDDRVGYKIALCQRDLGIYGGILLFGLLYGVSGKRIPGLPWYLWLLLGILPVAIDGLSQLISQPPLVILPYRESTWYFRSITGFLFGFMTAWFGYPMLEDSMKETRDIMKFKKDRFEAGKG